MGVCAPRFSRLRKRPDLSPAAVSVTVTQSQPRMTKAKDVVPRDPPEAGVRKASPTRRVARINPKKQSRWCDMASFAIVCSTRAMRSNGYTGLHGFRKRKASLHSLLAVYVASKFTVLFYVNGYICK